MNADAIAALEAELKGANPGVAIKRVKATRIKGYAYVRQPTLEEYHTMRLGRDGEGAGVESKLMSYSAYVRACFLGAINGAGARVSYDQLRDAEGPAYVASGALGYAVNDLAGENECETVDL